MLLLAAACNRSKDARGDSATSSGAAVATRAVIRAALVPDSGSAAALADSLTRDGWDTEISVGGASAPQWAVTIVIPGDAELAKLVVHALRQGGLDPLFLGLRAGGANLRVSVRPVNRGAHGMSARIRWLLSDDRRALLVEEDPRGVENDPVPNGFVFAREGAPLVQRDSVWDVAVAPDWHRVAYARAYITRAGETDTVPPIEWHRLAGSVGLMESVVRKNAFPTSSMVAAYGAARPFVVDVTAIDTAALAGIALPVAEGWQIAWAGDGSRLALGAPPQAISDDAPSTRWRLVDPATGAARGVAEVSSLPRPEWIEGPNLDVSTVVDMKQRRAFRSGDMDVESEDGWIRVSPRDGARLRAPRVIGPGIALTATTSGEYIAALAPDPAAKSYEPPNCLVIYHIVRQ